MLERLDPLDLALLGRTGGAIRAAVQLSGLPRVGGSADEPRVGIAPFCESLSTFVWAVVNGCPWQSAATCETLARAGQLEGLRWARAHDCPWGEGTCGRAAEGGHLEVLRWAREQGCRWNEWTCAHAARGGHLEVLRWARERGCPWTEDFDDSEMDCCSLASGGGHLEVLKWSREQDCPWDLWTCSYAAASG